jgi:hypothetical protein
MEEKVFIYTSTTSIEMVRELRKMGKSYENERTIKDRKRREGINYLNVA